MQAAFSQKITFHVTDSATKQPLSYVQIVKNKNQFLVFTNENGNATFTTKQNRLEISFYLLGYQTLTKTLDTNKESSLEIELQPLQEKLSAVILETKKKEFHEVTTLKNVEGTHIYAGKKTEVVNLDLTQGNKATNTPRHVFSKVVGLNIYDSNDGGLQLNIGGRGLDPNRTANFNTRQNDYDISADVLGYPESYYTPPSEGLEKIQVIRGAASLQYGTQFGGLINFITKRPVQNKPIEFITRNSVSSFQTLSNFTSLSGTVGKFSYYAYYNGKKGEGFRPNSDYKSNNVFAHLGYQFSEKTKVSFEISSLNYLAHQPGGLSDVEFLENPLQSYLTRNWFKVDWKLYNLKLDHNFTEKTKVSLSVFALDASRKAIGFRGDTGLDAPALFQSSSEGNLDPIDEFGEFLEARDLLVGNFRNYGTEVRFLSSYTLHKQEQFYVLGAKVYKANNSAQQGAGSLGTNADFNFVSTAAQYPNQNNFDFPNFNTSVFGEHIFNVTDKLSITPGFRFEHINTESEGSFYNAVTDTTIADNNSFVRNFVLLGLGLSYKPTPIVELYANASQNYRSVTFSDIRTVNPSFVIDENITDEEGFTADLGVRGSVKKSFTYDANIFGLYYGNRIGQIFSTEPPNRAKWVRKNIGTAFIYGLESLVQWNIQETYFKNHKNLKLGVFSNLSITKSEYIDSEDNGVEGNEVEFIPLVNLKTGVEFGYKNLLTSIQYTFVDNQFTDVTNSPYNPNNTTTVAGAIPSYDILDLTASYKFNKHFKLETGINNVLDNSYFTRRATGYPGPGIIPAAPRSYYATLEIKF